VLQEAPVCWKIFQFVLLAANPQGREIFLGEVVQPQFARDPGDHRDKVVGTVGDIVPVGTFAEDSCEWFRRLSSHDSDYTTCVPAAARSRALGPASVLTERDTFGASGKRVTSAGSLRDEREESFLSGECSARAGGFASERELCGASGKSRARAGRLRRERDVWEVSGKFSLAAGTCYCAGWGVFSDG
jgi:hypothetical protein